MNEESTSGIIDSKFLSEQDSQSVYEAVENRGFNRLMKVRRQGRWFMLKGLKPECRNQHIYLELLKKEYDLMVQLDHPNIVKAFAKEDNNELGPCIVMEYVDGYTLDAFLDTKPSVEVRKKVMEQLLDALCYIHTKQIIHRDLKPGNVLVTRNGNNVKIIDFGLSDADDYAILKQPAGTLKYMAPEQRQRGVKLDGRVDIYAFGMLLKMLFPNRYRRIAGKCVRADRDRRYANADVLKKSFVRRTRMLWFAFFVIVMTIAIVPTLLIRPNYDNGYSKEFNQLVDRAEHIIDSMYNPVINSIEKGEDIVETTQDFTQRVIICRDLLKEIKSPLLDNPKTRDEFRNAWENIHNDKYNMITFMLDDAYKESYSDDRLKSEEN